MKITDVHVYPLRLKLSEKFLIGNTCNYEMCPVIAVVKTNEGITGYGEAMPAWEVTGETQDSCMAAIKAFCNPSLIGDTLIGKSLNSKDDVLELIEFIDPLRAPQKIYGNPAAKAALEGAFWDICGKHMEMPVYKILGGEQKKIIFQHVTGIFEPEETLDHVRKDLEAGAGVIKLKTGCKKIGRYDNFERDIITVKKVSELVQQYRSKAKIVIDANQGYVTPKKAIEICSQFDHLIEYVEQPIVAGNKLGLKEVKKKLNTKIMADEAVHDLFDAELLLNLRAVDFFNLKIMKTGGIFRLIQIAERAAESGIPCQIGSMIENTLGTAQGIHAFFSHKNILTNELGAIRRFQTILGQGLSVLPSELLLDEHNGLGIEINDKDLNNA